MPNQPEFDWEPKNVRPTDPQTSHDAEAANAPRRGSQRWKIMEYVIANGSATADEWEAAFGWPHGPRATELKRRGYLVATGKTRQTRYATEAEVLEATPLGLAIFGSKA